MLSTSRTLWMLVAVMGLAVFFSPGRLTSNETANALAAAREWRTHGRLHFAPDASPAADVVYVSAREGWVEAPPAGFFLFMAPFEALGTGLGPSPQWWLVWILGPALAGLGWLSFRGILRAWDCDEASASWGALALYLSTVVWVYLTRPPTPTSVAVVLTSSALWVCLASSRRRGAAVMGGNALGLAIGLQGSLVWLTVPLGVVLWDRTRRPGALALFAAVSFLGTAAWEGLHWLQFGGWRAGYAIAEAQGAGNYPVPFQGWAPPALWLGLGQGLVLLCPPLLFALCAGKPRSTFLRVYAGSWIVAAAGITLSCAQVRYPAGLGVWGPRFLVPLVGFGLPLIVHGARRLRSRPGGFAFAALALLAGFTLQLAATALPAYLEVQQTGPQNVRALAADWKSGQLASRLRNIGNPDRRQIAALDPFAVTTKGSELGYYWGRLDGKPLLWILWGLASAAILGRTAWRDRRWLQTMVAPA